MLDISTTQKERDMAKVLVHALDEASSLPSLAKTKDCLDERIEETKMILCSGGFDHDATQMAKQNTPLPKPIRLRPFTELLAEANDKHPEGLSFDDLFSADEIKENWEYIERLYEEFDAVHRLDKYDILIPAFAGILGGAVDCLIGGFVKEQSGRNIPGTMTDWISKQFDKSLPPEKIKELEMIAKVTYDATDNRNTTIDVDGLSSYFHRQVSLGHDPVLGFVFGVLDMLRGTMTTIDFKGKFVIQLMENVSDRKAMGLFEAFTKVFLHMASDVNTSRGLPVPFMALFNKLQFGKIGDNDTIAELVKSMYGQGYDFRHFCSMSIPVMITEVIVRVSYFAKRLSEGFCLQESIPIGVSHMKKPKLGTMLFIAHTANTAINAGKVAVTKNPLDINYPEWLAFSRYSVKQLKWILIDKPTYRDRYVRGILNGEWDEIQEKLNELFDHYVFY